MEVEKFKPMADRILVKPDEVTDTVTNAGIYVVKQEKEQPTKGTVVQLGTGVIDVPFTVQIGDKVMFSKYAGSDINFEKDNKPYKILREVDILGYFIK